MVTALVRKGRREAGGGRVEVEEERMEERRAVYIPVRGRKDN